MIRLMRAAWTQTCLCQLLQEPGGEKGKKQMHVKQREEEDGEEEEVGEEEEKEDGEEKEDDDEVEEEQEREDFILVYVHF